MKLNLKKIISNKIYDYMEYINGYVETKHLYDNSKNIQRVFIFGTPNHGNLGDHAIAYAERKIVEDYFLNYRIIEIVTDDINKNMKSLRKGTNKNDILLFCGGGNLGDEYFWEEEARRKIISKFPNNNIIIFPQTIYFKKDKFGEKQLKISKKIYNKHKSLTIVAREKVSFDLMKQGFQNNNVILTPDIVMYLNKTDLTIQRKGALMCTRSDMESTLTNEEKNSIRSIVQKYYNNIRTTDTVVNHSILSEQREEELNLKFSEFRKAELVITDRLHGMVFAAITSTPCIVIGNYNHKVKGTYQWLKHLSYIKFVENIDEIEEDIRELRNSETTPYDSSFAMEYYQKIISKMKKE
ncbi:polysaccharide pyruvyl transferase family protein [Clostridium bowmanii]|uniref:polysaccharide pyruvyl transferase family protein n=1 Tax=Clostridium bowmanii TaxID=132925 RepID=UPI001C0BF9FA|nr:polysaccharide pyruvyl transferase family protein [Clostridium bowmanii]MBU3191225.1 polysaccharide pyruvyl transferase family protein [Clostridium bowmanii]MCA1075673.1 polysaccharide pyruvyl transferase family protein [Clostridium bowmanii]